MIPQINIQQKNKIDQLEKSLAELWDVLSPQLKGRKLLWDKFLNLQTRVRLMNLKLEKELANGSKNK